MASLDRIRVPNLLYFRDSKISRCHIFGVKRDSDSRHPDSGSDFGRVPHQDPLLTTDARIKDPDSQQVYASAFTKCSSDL